MLKTTVTENIKTIEDIISDIGEENFTPEDVKLIQEMMGISTYDLTSSSVGVLGSDAIRGIINATKQNLKTINGQQLWPAGNIEISEADAYNLVVSVDVGVLDESELSLGALINYIGKHYDTLTVFASEEQFYKELFKNRVMVLHVTGREIWPVVMSGSMSHNPDSFNSILIKFTPNIGPTYGVVGDFIYGEELNWNSFINGYLQAENFGIDFNRWTEDGTTNMHAIYDKYFFYADFQLHTYNFGTDAKAFTCREYGHSNENAWCVIHPESYVYTY